MSAAKRLSISPRRKEHDAELLRRLTTLYPDPRSELNFRNHFELVTAVILSAQCTDRKVNEVTPELFRRYPDFTPLSEAELSSVEAIIRPVNYYRTKARNLIAMAREVCARFGGDIPRNYADLTSLPGVGNKTANVVLAELGEVPAFPVDTHVKRVSNRLGLSRGSTPEKVEADLTARFLPAAWRNLHHQLIFHGRRVCKAGRPLCAECALASLCPTSNGRAAGSGKKRQAKSLRKTRSPQRSK